MTIRKYVIAALIMTLVAGVLPARAQQAAVSEVDVWRTFAQTLDPGTFVMVQLKDGSRVRGTFLQVSTDTLLVKPKTRVPVPARAVPLAGIESIERKKEGMSPGLKIVIGMGVGAAVILAWGILAVLTSGR